ncbi:MAG: hypothetical protein IJ262_01510 [Clostridia bacterium]|nr:hypothetical protein [Clostridia bacterium]
MKKTISVLLSVLMIFSVCSVMLAAAEGTTYTATFIDWDGSPIEFVDVDGNKIGNSVEAAEGDIIKAPANPTRESDYAEINGVDREQTRYTWKGWAVVTGTDSEGNYVYDDSVYYHQNSLPLVSGNVTYIAVYSSEDVSGNQTFFQFIQSIFYRLNLIFEYFFTIFD